MRSTNGLLRDSPCSFFGPCLRSTGDAAVVPLGPLPLAIFWAFLTDYVTSLLFFVFTVILSAAICIGTISVANLFRAFPAGLVAISPLPPVPTAAIFWATTWLLLTLGGVFACPETFFLLLKWRTLLSATRCILGDFPPACDLTLLPTGHVGGRPVRPIAHMAIFWATRRDVWARFPNFNQL